ncbi:MAG: MotA/TolQ/ExbB proton channel family protein [Ignavibacteriae bacterium]|nr:MotA/TolQ/ExbB proton channel family protein [Ignavibacteriota bacterium]MCB9214497.1 MotA/TolQ/ExbB proton channel family protein [Ignavibacteria bacterium]
MNLISFFTQGGWIMYPILLCSLIAVYIIIERVMALRRAQEMPEGFSRQLRDFIRVGDIKSALLYASRYDIPIARVINSGLVKVHRGYRRVQQAMEDQGRAEMNLLERYMGILATVAGVAPLLGFLGTVIGIAIAFQEIAAQGGQVSADVLADGISQALYTTVFGLIVGIPAFAGYNYLNGMIRGVVSKLENQAREIFDVIEEELPAEGRSKTSIKAAEREFPDGGKTL